MDNAATADRVKLNLGSVLDFINIMFRGSIGWRIIDDERIRQINTVPMILFFIENINKYIHEN
jgi:hypothetical protein